MTLSLRRRAIARSSLAAVASSLLVTSCGDDTVAPNDAELVEAAYREPEVLVPDSAGVHQLHLAPTEIEVDGVRWCVPAYNGAIPGPTIRVAEGTDRRVRIDLHNDLSSSDYRQVAGLGANGTSSCHDFNLTNLHGHGLHVQPNLTTEGRDPSCVGEGCGEDGRYHGDDVLIEVGPGQMAQYRWDLDEHRTHDDGTDWYHPHIHGATAIQVASGAAGALLVGGPTDRIPAVAAAKERVMVMSTLPIEAETSRPLADGETCSEATLSFRDFTPVTESMPALLNGVRRPTMTTAPGQVERWRFVHAGNPDEVAVTIHRAKGDDCEEWEEASLPVAQMARDGITLPKLFRTDAMWMAPGYRIDALVTMPTDAGTLCVVSTPEFLEPDLIAKIRVDAAQTATSTVLPDDAELAAVAKPTTWTADVEGEPTTVGCDTVEQVHQKVVLLVPTPGEQPETVPSGETELGSCDPSEHAHHEGGTEGCVCPAPNINCRKFEDRRARGYRSDRVMTVGTSERWEITAFDGHPFHIHINPFLVCPSPTAKEPDFPHWRDTLFVVAAAGPRQVLTHFEDFTGQFVVHCHKLNHEDEGMMELVEICAPGDTECLCQGEDAAGECISQAGCQDDDVQCRFAAAATAAYPEVPAPDPELCGPDAP